MSTEVQEILAEKKLIILDKIRPNEMNPRKFRDPEKLDEFAESIEKYGVLQPITVRPIQDEKVEYEIVFGERRYRASQRAGKIMIPCLVREMSDAEALDIMVTENLQREDVHPLDEAEGYRQMLASDRYTVEEIAARMCKSRSYVARRLKLVDLHSNFKEMFYSGEIALGHALELCRLSLDDQEEISQNRSGYPLPYLDIPGMTVANLQSYMDNNYWMKLSAAGFKTSDPDLYPEAGPCSTCPKRSGNNLALFPDIEPEDICFDRPCYREKQHRALLIKVEEAKEDPEIRYFLKVHDSEVEESVAASITGDGYRILEEYTDFYERRSQKNLPKGLMLNGYQPGQILHVDISAHAGTKADRKETLPRDEFLRLDFNSEIERIEQREARAKELDQEKIQKALIEQLREQDLDAATLFDNKPEDHRVELLTAIYLAFNKVSWSYEHWNQFLETLGMEPSKENEWGNINNIYGPEALRHILDHVEEYDNFKLLEIAYQALRMTIFDQFTRPSILNPDQSNEARLFRMWMETVAPEMVSAAQEKQQRKAEKREARVDERLAALREELAGLEAEESEAA